MAQYPIEADKLLAAASLLVPAKPGRGRPSYTGPPRVIVGDARLGFRA